MSLVATLISNPTARALSQPLADKAARAVGASRADWLAPAVACDLPVEDGMAEAEALSALRTELDGAPVDCVVQAADDRRRHILVADMDSTMIDQECIDELADVVGLKEHVAAITARAMNGEIEFEGALRERVALLEGLEAAIIDRVIAERITLASGARELVATMNAAGAFTLLVSGGFTTFTDRIAAMLGFWEHQANTLLAEGGRLTGKVAEPILGRAAKADALRAVAARLGLTTNDAIAVGDGANDLDMVCLAGTGVALHAKPAVAAAAPHRIDHGDLTALLYMQGYRREEIISQ
jgi:phosphoserine phosphatase